MVARRNPRQASQSLVERAEAPAPARPRLDYEKRLKVLHGKLSAYSRSLAREAQSKRGGLYEFVKYFWHVLEPQTPLVEGWAMEAICDHLEAVTFGEINRLLMTVPPGFCKSLLTDVFWPAWEWGPMKMPHMRYVTFSYSSSLTERDNGRFRDLITSREYIALWGEVFTTRKVGEMKVTNDKTGWKLASSVGGVGTGERGNRVICDDPHNIKQSESDTVRGETVRWYREAMSNRLNDMATGAIVTIMQRSHDADVAGVILDAGLLGYCVLLIDMELDVTRQTYGQPNEIGWMDPREEENELAWPERFPEAECRKLRATIGPWAWAAQYQQMPVPRGGGILKREWWRLWDQTEAQKYGLKWDKGLKEFPITSEDLIIASLDTAFGKDEESDFCAMTVWGLWTDKGRNVRVMLMYAWAKRLTIHGPPIYREPGEAQVNWEQRKKEAWGCVEWVADTCRRYRVQRLLIEAKASGLDVAHEMARLYSRERWGVELVTPIKDKVARGHEVVPILSNGLVYAPENAWSDMVLDQCARVPKAPNDDLFDTVTQALSWMRRNGLIFRDEEIAAALEEEAQYSGPPGSAVTARYGVG